MSGRVGCVEFFLSSNSRCLYGSLARSVSKPLKVPSLARSVPKPLKVPSLARSVPKPLLIELREAGGHQFGR